MPAFFGGWCPGITLTFCVRPRASTRGKKRVFRGNFAKSVANRSDSRSNRRHDGFSPTEPGMRRYGICPAGNHPRSHHRLDAGDRVFARLALKAPRLFPAGELRGIRHGRDARACLAAGKFRGPGCGSCPSIAMLFIKAALPGLGGSPQEELGRGTGDYPATAIGSDSCSLGSTGQVELWVENGSMSSQR